MVNRVNLLNKTTSSTTVCARGANSLSLWVCAVCSLFSSVLCNEHTMCTVCKRKSEMRCTTKCIIIYYNNECMKLKGRKKNKMLMLRQNWLENAMQNVHKTELSAFILTCGAIHSSHIYTIKTERNGEFRYK